MEEKQKFIVIEGSVQNSEEAIRMCGEAFCKAGYVGEAFIEDCIKREKEFPTGLCTDIPVAIPHCKSEAINESGICYLRLEKPVTFQRMDDEEESIRTRSIFNIAIKEAGDHIDFLQKMMGFVTNTELIQQLEEADIEKVPELLKVNFAESEEE